MGGAARGGAGGEDQSRRRLVVTDSRLESVWGGREGSARLTSEQEESRKVVICVAGEGRKLHDAK